YLVPHRLVEGPWHRLGLREDRGIRRHRPCTHRGQFTRGEGRIRTAEEGGGETAEQGQARFAEAPTTLSRNGRSSSPRRRRQGVEDAPDGLIIQGTVHEPRLEHGWRQGHSRIEHGVEERSVAISLLALDVRVVAWRAVEEGEREQVSG